MLLGDEIAAHRYRAMQRGHTEALMPMVTEVMAEAGAAFSDLDLLACTVGPGSFTGIRAGLAAAQGLSRALAIPLLGVTTLEAVAFAAARDAENSPANTSGAILAVALETGRTEFYLQCFSFEPAPVADASCVSPGDARAMLPEAPLVLAGDGARRLHEALANSEPVVTIAPGPGLPDARDVARIAARRVGDEGKASMALKPPPRPIYLHPPHVTVPRAGGRLRP